MSIKEWQVKDFEGFLFNDDCQAIVFGDEGCIYKALDSKWIELFNRYGNKEIMLRYLTPVVPQKYIYQIYKYIEKMADIKKIKVTFNDYGLLYICRDLIAKGKIIPVLGRILSRSITDCAWYHKLLENEEEELFKLITNHSFNDERKIEILNKFGIKEIEINIGNDEYKLLKNSNIDLTIYISNAIVAVGRLCYAARWYGIDLPKCKDDPRCRKKLDIELKEMWGKIGWFTKNLQMKWLDTIKTIILKVMWYTKSCYMVINLII